MNKTENPSNSPQNNENPNQTDPDFDEPNNPSNNKPSKMKPIKLPEKYDPNILRAKRISGHPYSLPSFKVTLFTAETYQEYTLDTKNWVQRIRYDKNYLYKEYMKKAMNNKLQILDVFLGDKPYRDWDLEPTYMDIAGKIYTWNPQDREYLCSPTIEDFAIAYDISFLSDQHNRPNPGTKDYYDYKVPWLIDGETGMSDLYLPILATAYQWRQIRELIAIYLFPIGNWPYFLIHNREALFENENYESRYIYSEDGSTVIGYEYQQKETERIIKYDRLQRPNYIIADDGFVFFEYLEKDVNLKAPDCKYMLWPYLIGGFDVFFGRNLQD